MSELKFRSVDVPIERKFYYIFFGSGLMVRAYYKGGDWQLPESLMRELLLVMSEDELVDLDVSKCKIFELVVEEKWNGDD